MKKIDRCAAKAGAMAKVVFHHACANVSQMYFGGRVAVAVAAAERLKAIARTPAIVFRSDGRVDKRRYRRYVAKHGRGSVLLKGVCHG